MAKQLEEKKNVQVLEERVKKEVIGKELQRLMGSQKKSRNAFGASGKKRSVSSLSALKMLDTIREDYSEKEEPSPVNLKLVRK
mmetsp:Transcript_17623/g.27276  ORF Transcript_17623/g.27276 Transcript_17623/m.27276 type:complete len:83 (+) Transcript_17623:648-896(+)